MNQTVEATIKDVFSCTKKTRDALIGIRVSIIELQERYVSTVPGIKQYSGIIVCIIKTRPKSRIKKENYRHFFLARVALEDIDYGTDYEID